MVRLQHAGSRHPGGRRALVERRAGAGVRPRRHRADSRRARRPRDGDASCGRPRRRGRVHQPSLVLLRGADHRRRRHPRARAGRHMHTPARFYDRSLLVHTYSKSALAPGQRLGFLALPPTMPDRPALRQGSMAAAFSTSNGLPDAIMQYALPDIEGILLDMKRIQLRRDRMLEALRGMGYEVPTPEATFYLLCRCPIEDDLDFSRRLAREKVMVLPGRACEMPGFFRISLTATDDMVDRALPVFERAIR